MRLLRKKTTGPNQVSALLYTLRFDAVLHLFLRHLIERVAIGCLSKDDAALLQTFSTKVGRLADEADRECDQKMKKFSEAE